MTNQLEIVTVPPRTRAGTYSVFARRYDPIENDNGEIQVAHQDLPKDINERQVWTMVECDGNIYIVPGYHIVNYMARVITRRGWSDQEHAMGFGYRW